MDRILFSCIRFLLLSISSSLFFLILFHSLCLDLFLSLSFISSLPPFYTLCLHPDRAVTKYWLRLLRGTDDAYNDNAVNVACIEMHSHYPDVILFDLKIFLFFLCFTLVQLQAPALNAKPNASVVSSLYAFGFYLSHNFRFATLCLRNEWHSDMVASKIYSPINRWSSCSVCKLIPKCISDFMRHGFRITALNMHNTKPFIEIYSRMANKFKIISSISHHLRS